MGNAEMNVIKRRQSMVGRGKIRTVTKDEFRNASNVHGNAAEKVVVAAQADQGLRGHSALKSAEAENSRCVGDEETDQTKQGWIGWSRC